MAKQEKRRVEKPTRKRKAKKSTLTKTSKAQKPTATKVRKTYLSKDTKKQIAEIAKKTITVVLPMIWEATGKSIEEFLQKKEGEARKPKSRKSKRK